ncbi:unnamed protein product [Rotaria socialis]|uniref:RDD domain-containing protein n=1 Tax=Rotaria socialis TaxID=392032 RepID=A0A817MZ77_9BILA|nr:unnamed protein product [Rotaria socialis]CAF3194755.1 unnamed protein product [Rotaria socialis]CAF4186686.1 unnamed protein product [Rotaria socialis]CAF4236146.1 unnamed protein product [Rotaria socialis]
MSCNPSTSAEKKPSDTSEIKSNEMTVEEYTDLVSKWHQAYYTWNMSCVTYSNMMMMNASQQFFRQIPVISSSNFLEMINEVNRSQPFDPLAEIRNARLKIASVWRRFLAEIVDFFLLHVFKILIVFFLANYFDIIDESRLTLTYMISNILYDETFSFPLELLCIELGYLITSIAFESFCLTRYGATPGKRLLRLRVLKCDHPQMQENGDLTIEPVTTLTSGAAFTRSTFKCLMATFLFPALIVALFTSQYRQTNYDMAANAVVVVIEPRE